MHVLTQISSYLLAQSWQIAVLIMAIALISFALRHRSAHIRYLLWLVVLAKCLVPPLLTVPVAVLPEKAVLDLATASVVVPQASEAVAPEPVSPPTHVVQVPEPNTTVTQKSLSLSQTLALAWMAGAVLYGLAALMQALWSTIWLRRRRLELPVDQYQQAEAIFTQLGIRSAPKIWLVPGMAQPFVLGLWRGSIYLPANFFQVKSAEHCRDIMVHEICHVLRLDAAVNLLQTMAQAIFWYHPFVWCANQRIRMEREKCCDEMVVAHLGVKAKEYSTAVVKALVTEHESNRPVPSLAVAGSVKDIEERIKTMLRPGKQFHKRPSFIVTLMVLSIALLTVPIGCVLTNRVETDTTTDLKDEPANALHQAVADGDTERVKLLIAQGADVNARDEWTGVPVRTAGRVPVDSGFTPLYFAIWNNEEESARILIEAGADVNKHGNDGGLGQLGPLGWAVWDANIAIVRMLIKAGADVNYRRENGMTPLDDAIEADFVDIARLFVGSKIKISALHRAVLEGDLTQVTQLVESGTDVDAKGELGGAPSYWAVCTGQKEILEYLLDNGADVNVKSVDGRTLLHQASSRGFTKIVEQLLAKGADVNIRYNKPVDFDIRYEHGGTPLHYAASNGHTDTVKLLLTNGADVSARDTDGGTVLLTPAAKGHTDVVKLLVAQGIDVNATRHSGRRSGRRPALANAAYAGHEEIVKFLIESGAEVNLNVNDGGTALAIAAYTGREGIVKFLIESGADVNLNLNGGGTALGMAASQGHASIVGLLIDNGADVNAKLSAKGGSALLFAIRQGPIENDVTFTEIVEKLIANGADVNAKGPQLGDTPLHLAVARGRLKAARLLIGAGANVKATDNEGNTPLSEAAADSDIFKLLHKHGGR